MRETFTPGLREAKRKAVQAAAELDRRRKQAEFDAEVGALAASAAIQQYRLELLAWGEALMPGGDMDAAACYWFRRGLERAVKVLDQRLATAEDRDE
jgi:hypothetical protein